MFDLEKSQSILLEEENILLYKILIQYKYNIHIYINDI